MSALPKTVRGAHFGAQRNNNRRRTLTPAKDGTLEVTEFQPDFEHRKVITGAAAGEKKKGKGSTYTRRRTLSPAERAMKQLDVIAFNGRAEEVFVYWLSEKIAGTHGEGVELGWIWPNAAFELDVSIETAKRYLLKHTADRAEFRSTGGRVFIRDE